MSSPLVAERRHNRAIQQLLQSCVLNTAFSSEPENLEEFLAECIQEGLAGGLARQIDRHGHPNQELSRRSREVFKNQFFQYAQYQVLLSKINQELMDKGIQVLLLKGAALNLGCYEPGVRHVSDLDLFVPSEDKQKLVDLLAEMGFHRSKNTSMFSRSGLLIDLHGPELGRVEAATGLKGAELWERSTVDPQHAGFRLLSPSDEIAYLAIHSLKHSYARYIWFWDLAICLQRPGHKPPSAPGQAYAVHCAEFLLRELLQDSRSRECPLTKVDQRLLRGMLSDHRHPLGQVLIGCNLPDTVKRLKYFWTTLSESGSLSPTRLLEKLVVLGRLSLSHLYQSLAQAPPEQQRSDR